MSLVYKASLFLCEKYYGHKRGRLCIFFSKIYKLDLHNSAHIWSSKISQIEHKLIKFVKNIEYKYCSIQGHIFVR